MSADERAPQHSKPVRLAGAILHAAVERDWPKVRHYVDRLNTECTAHGLGLALVAWCDALAEHANDGMPEFGKVRVLDVDQDSGARITDPNPQQQWASALVAARAAGDHTAFRTLLNELNAIEDGRERGQYASALIQGVAGTIRTFPRGYTKAFRGGSDGS